MKLSNFFKGVQDNPKGLNEKHIIGKIWFKISDILDFILLSEREKLKFNSFCHYSKEFIKIRYELDSKYQTKHSIR